MAVSPGFRPDHVLSGQISLPWNRYPDWPARLAFNETLLKNLARQPGVLAAGVVNNVPLSGNSGKSAATVEGHVLLPGESARGHYSYGVDGDYFAAMGFSLREGRFLTADDSRRSTRVCVVDQDFARYYCHREFRISTVSIRSSGANRLSLGLHRSLAEGRSAACALTSLTHGSRRAEFESRPDSAHLLHNADKA
jgi:hypothetical protein